MTSTRVTQLALAFSALAAGVLAYWVQIDNLPEPLTTDTRAMATVAAALSFLVAGLVAGSRRPDNPLGSLMVVTCFALLARQFRYSHDPLVFTTFFLFGELGYVLVGHVALAYPAGRVTYWLERAWLRIAYAVAIAFPLATLLVYDGTTRLTYFDPAARESLLVVSPDPALVRDFEKAFIAGAYGILATIFVLLIVRKIVRATPRARRLLAPLWIAAAVAALRASLDGILVFASPPRELVYQLFWWQIAGLIALPLALLLGLLRARLARTHVGDLVVQLDDTTVDGLQDELAEALGDSTLELGLWIPERSEYLDAGGNTLPVPVDGPTRAVTRIEQDGAPLAVLVHDPSLRDEPKLVDAVAAAARLALVNARLHAEVRAQLEAVQESRARIVAAADEERRRIERDLHDGAQQRLVALALELRTAQRRMGEETDPELEELLESTADELQIAVQELRDLAQGIHPGILTQGGLSPAIESLASRIPLPVTVDVTLERLPPDVEGTAYFIACEALTNVVKHSEATQAAVRAWRHDGMLVIEVEDNGVGGATASRGTGLRGLVDRVEAQGGFLRVESGPRSGTRVVGEIPCES